MSLVTDSYCVEWLNVSNELILRLPSRSFRTNRFERSGMTNTFLRDFFLREVIPCTLAVVPSRTETGPSIPAVQYCYPALVNFQKMRLGNPIGVTGSLTQLETIDSSAWVVPQNVCFEEFWFSDIWRSDPLGLPWVKAVECDLLVS
jgi:hypothetical protein